MKKMKKMKKINSVLPVFYETAHDELASALEMLTAYLHHHLAIVDEVFIILNCWI